MTQPFGAAVAAAIQASVVPTAADIMAARSVALELASRGTDAPLTNDVLDVWLQRLHGLTLATATNQIRIEREQLEWIPPERDCPGLVKIRGTAAVATAIAQLIADGLLTKVHGNPYREDVERHLSIAHEGGSNNVSYRLNYPEVDPFARWRPVVRYNEAIEAPAEVLDAAGLIDDLDDLLGSRGIRSLTEAHHAYRRRLWLGAAALLATASEAAWFSLGRRVGAPGSRLARLAAEGEDSAKVHDLAAQRVRELHLAATAVINDVAAHGAHLRDIRNYALHPGGPHDVEREPAFTEAGCTALFMASRRYLVKLADIWAAAGQ